MTVGIHPGGPSKGRRCVRAGRYFRDTAADEAKHEAAFRQALNKLG
ncbi:hypothetical protein [Streptomyces cuspidosporus]|uniref:Ferritin-like diiron domain-containing protein n=1 Tax=Streptomyces cuspidosporus TaxID=66882 RepID=A0ABN3GXZ3_9ACTN